MITKAQVVKRSDTAKNKFVVRIPIFNGSATSTNHTPDSELSEATVCTLKGCDNMIQPGDIVYVSFEDNDVGRPVIIGHLYLADNSASEAVLSISALNVSESATLPEKTKLGSLLLESIKKVCRKVFNSN